MCPLSADCLHEMKRNLQIPGISPLRIPRREATARYVSAFKENYDFFIVPVSSEVETTLNFTYFGISSIRNGEPNKEG
jgi:hypothetical protein